MEPIVTRRARPDDVDAVESYHARCFERTYADQLSAGMLSPPDRDGVREQFRCWFATDAEVDTHVVDRGDGPIAHFTVRDHLLCHLFVDPNHHGRGIGRVLLARAESLIAADGHSEFELHTRVDNTAAIAFYERAGWTHTGRVLTTIENGISYDEHVMIKQSGTEPRAVDTLRHAPPAPLASQTWGSGDRVAMLLHGQFGSSEGWWEVAPAIAAQGYRVVALDLPGHGDSPSDSSATLETTVRQIVGACPDAEVAIGHSLGALLLAHCAHLVGVRRAVYVDSPFTYEMSARGAAYRSRIGEAAARRTLDWLTANRPHWKPQDRSAEARAAAAFDVDTSVSLMTSLSGGDHRPPPEIPSLVIAANPSNFLSVDDLAGLRRDGVEVAEVDGAGHTVWYGYVEEFMAAMSGWI